jgi:hypothetical protein
MCREWELPVLVPPIRGSLGHVYVLSGRVAEGRRMLAEALGAYRAMGAGWILPLGALHLAEAEAREGNLAEAGALADEGWRLALGRRERGIEAQALYVRAEVAATGPDAARVAAPLYGEALALAEQLGMRPLAAHCCLGLGRLHRRGGDEARASDLISRAAALYSEMDMPFWAARAR